MVMSEASPNYRKYDNTQALEKNWSSSTLALTAFVRWFTELHAMAKQYDVLYRLLLLGDSGVGKTCLLCRLTDNEFFSPHISTIGKHWYTR